MFETLLMCSVINGCLVIGTNKFSIDNKTVTIYPAPIPSAPVGYINTFDGDAAEIHARLRLVNFIDFSLVVISNIVWDHDMAPWNCPPLSSHDVA